MGWLARIFRRGVVEPAQLGKLEREPLYRAPGAWTMDQVESALDSLERGEFREAGRLAYALLCDEEIQALSGLRCGTVTGLPFHLDPEVPGMLDDWNYMLPRSVQDQILFDALMLGFCWAQDQRTSYDDLPCWRPWPIEATRYDTYRGVWQIETQNRGYVDVEEGTGRWALFQARFARPWLGGYIRAIAPMMIIRQSTLYNWANHAQVYATPSRILTAPTRESEIEDVQRAIMRLRKLVGDSTIVLPAGLKMELLELKELTYQIYERLRKAIDEALQIIWVGQLGTAKAAGGWGSAKTETRVTQQLLERDVQILQPTAHVQIMAPYDAWKRGTRRLSQVPRPIWDCTPPADRQADAQCDLTQAQADYQRALEFKVYSGLDLGDGYRVDLVELAKRRGLPVRKASPEEIRVATTPPPRQLPQNGAAAA